jgi:hypothetical protein
MVHWALTYDRVTVWNSIRCGALPLLQEANQWHISRLRTNAIAERRDDVKVTYEAYLQSIPSSMWCVCPRMEVIWNSIAFRDIVYEPTDERFKWSGDKADPRCLDAVSKIWEIVDHWRASRLFHLALLIPSSNSDGGSNAVTQKPLWLEECYERLDLATSIFTYGTLYLS